MARRRGSPKGKVGSVSPFFPSFQAFSLPISYTETHPESYLSDPLSLIDTYTTILFLSLSFSLSLWVHPFSLPHPLSALGSVRRQPCPTYQRCQKWGHNFWTDDLATPQASTPPPPDGFITSYAAHLKPIELLGERECLTQISTSEGVSATLGNWELLTGFGV